MPVKKQTEHGRSNTKERILEVARCLFVERGIEATTMRDIAGRVGCSATAIYQYFRDKNELFDVLCAADIRSLAEEISFIEAIDDPIARLRRLGVSYARFAMTYPNHYRLMFMTSRTEHDKGATDTDRPAPNQDAYTLLKRMVLRQVTDAHACGCFRADLTDPQLIAQILWAGMHGLCALEISLGHAVWTDWRPFNDRLELMVESLLNGVLVRSND